MLSNSAGLLFQNISFSYDTGFSFKGLDLSILDGQMIALLGPNGCGKTTLLKLASGVLSPVAGNIKLFDTDLKKLSRRQIARQIAVVPQQFNIPFAYSVKELVLLGRTPFANDFSGETRRDRKIVAESLKLTEMSAFADRYFNELSGGERQKTIIAMALAQEPKILLLDEPTSHLDINHMLEILELLKSLNQNKKLTVVAALHDLNLASIYFNRLVLLDRGNIFADGSPTEVITERTITQVFSTNVQVNQHPTISVPQITVLPFTKPK
jgi:iron complex transport system ATP-binding protein